MRLECNMFILIGLTMREGRVLRQVSSQYCCFEQLSQVLVMLDTSPTTISIYTRHHTLQEDHIDAAMARKSSKSLMRPKVLCHSQLILVNKYSEIMGATEATIYLFMDEEQRWLTPALTSGVRNSATRQYALQH